MHVQNATNYLRNGMICLPTNLQIISSSWENVSLPKILSTFLRFFRPTSLSALFSWLVLSFLSEIFAFSFSHLWKRREKAERSKIPILSETPISCPCLGSRVTSTAFFPKSFGSFFSSQFLIGNCYTRPRNATKSIFFRGVLGPFMMYLYGMNIVKSFMRPSACSRSLFPQTHSIRAFKKVRCYKQF